MPQAKTSLWVGLAKESVAGTFVAPVDWLPVTTFDGFNNIHYIADRGIRGSAVSAYGYVAAQGEGEITFSGDVFPESIPRVLVGLMGEIASITSRTVADGVTNTTTLLTSATAAFTQADIGRTVAGTGIPANTTIISVTSATNVVLSAPETATASGVSITIGAAAQYAHNVTLLNTAPMQPPTYSLTVFNGLIYTAYSGLLFSEAAFKFAADGLLVYSCKALGFLSTNPAGPYTAAFNANPPIAAWTGGLWFGTTLATNLESADVTLKRTVNPISNIDQSQSPYKIWAGGDFACSGKAMFIYESEAIGLTPYQAGTNQIAVLNFSTGTGAAKRSLQFVMSKLLFINPTKPVWSKDYVQTDTTFEAVGNTTDVGASVGYGPVRVQTQSAITAYTT